MDKYSRHLGDESANIALPAELLIPTFSQVRCMAERKGG
jgi:hypothetical protein